MHYFLPFFVVLGVLSFASCPADLAFAPATVLVRGFELRTDGGEGAATAAITEVWAFADGEFLGVFPLPARIPVVKVGTTAFRFEAGIHQDGRSVTPEIYPFYTAVTRTLELVSGGEMDLGTLPVGYRDDAVFGFVEDFEPDRQRVFTERLAGTTFLEVQQSVVRSGGAAGAVALSDTNRLVELATTGTFRNLNTVPINVWLEADFLSDAPGVFGVIGRSAGVTVRQFDPGFLPRGEWTKIYFNLSPVVGSANLDEIRIAVSTLLPADRSSGTLYLDNLKLLYFQP